MTSKEKIGYLTIKAWLLILFLAFLNSCCGSCLNPFPYYHLNQFVGKVIDADTKKPIEGAAVLAVYEKTLPSIQGGISVSIDAQETLTDKNGEFKIPEVKIWFGGKRGHPRGHLIIFKPVYGVFPRHASSSAGGESKTWPPPNKYIVYELPKLKAMKERKDNLIFSRPFGIPYEKMKNFTNLINEEYWSLGLPGISVPKGEK